jgi:carboxyl-terminal processing protease
MDRDYFKGLISGIVIALVVGFIYMGADELVTYLSDNGIYFDQGTERQELGVDQKINRIITNLERHYYEDVDIDQLLDGVFSGILAAVGDPYTVYYSEDEYKAVTESTQGVYSGIGSYISYDPEEEVFILLPFLGSPSEKAGVLPGDILLQVDGVDVSNKSIDETVSMVKGEEGTIVILSIYREFENRTLEVPVLREQIDVPTIGHEMLEDNIGYIQITEFDEVTYDQFRTALEELETEGQEGLIIDLRNNPGGLLHIVEAITDELLEKDKLIVYTENKQGKRSELRAKNNNAFKKPLVLLINGNSASASEILAGAVKDHGIGTLVGTTTFGKGLVQTLLQLGDGSAMKLTISRYFTPNGNYIHDKGIEPDVEVQLPEELRNRLTIDREDDIQLNKALEIIKGAIE